MQLIVKEIKGNRFPANNPRVRIWGKLDNEQSPQSRPTVEMEFKN